MNTNTPLLGPSVDLKVIHKGVSLSPFYRVTGRSDLLSMDQEQSQEWNPLFLLSLSPVLYPLGVLSSGCVLLPYDVESVLLRADSELFGANSFEVSVEKCGHP